MFGLLDYFIREHMDSGFTHIGAEFGHDGADADVVGGKYPRLGQRCCLATVHSGAL